MAFNCPNKKDEELVTLSLSNQDFFYCLASRYEQKLLGYIRKTFFLSLHDCQDILQNTFIKIYKNLNGFDTQLKFSSWAYRIAHNEAISFLRKKKSRPDIGSYFTEEEYQKISSDFNLEHQLDREFQKDKVNEILSTLDEKYREVLVLRFLENKSYEEISDIIKRPIGTVATLIKRAKINFKKSLEANYD